MTAWRLDQQTSLKQLVLLLLALKIVRFLALRMRSLVWRITSREGLAALRIYFWLNSLSRCNIPKPKGAKKVYNSTTCICSICILYVSPCEAEISSEEGKNQSTNFLLLSCLKRGKKRSRAELHCRMKVLYFLNKFIIECGLKLQILSTRWAWII